MRLHIWQWLGLLAVAAAIVVTMALASGVDPFNTPIQQPFPFNHKKHIEADWTCSACHVYVDQESFASIPKARDCVTCHESEGISTPDTDKIRQLVEKGGDFPWFQVYWVSDYVYFSHRRHVDLGELDCVLCHGDMTQVTEPVTRQAIKIAMNRCIDCHREQGVTDDCLACHR